MGTSNLIPHISELGKRQQFDDGDDGGDYFWWSQTGQILRWTLFGVVVLLFVLYFVTGYYHAKRRMRQGLPPLAYHRWLLTRNERMQHDPAYQFSHPEYFVYRPDHYNLHPFPPPVYDPNAPPPPTYQPPQNPAKADPSQWRADPTRVGEPAPRDEEHAAPSGPPPAPEVQANHTGLSSSSNNPYKTGP